MARSISPLSSASDEGRSPAWSAVRAARIPQPMSTPTAEGITAWSEAITVPMAAPSPKCTSGITATCPKMNGRLAVLCSCRIAWGSMSARSATQALTGCRLLL